MTNADTKRRDQQVTNYLQYMQALRVEMATAMECIADSALTPLQECISRQEALCAELVLLVKALKPGTPSTALASPANVDPTMAVRVREAGESLRQTNLEYSALLKHSSRSLALLSSLCNTYTGQQQEARGPRSKYQTWSCEM